MLIFRNASLHPVLNEALKNNCRLILANDNGVYLISESREKNSSGNIKNIAYAAGCNPVIDPIEEYWDRIASVLGGDDFGEYHNPRADVFIEVLNLGLDLALTSSSDGIFLQAIKPDQEPPPLPPRYQSYFS